MNLSEDHSAIFLEEIISKQVPFCINIQPIIPRFQERGWKSDVNQPQAIQRRTAIKAKLLSVTVAAFGIAAIATPALADFWIVREGPTGKCMVVDRKPTDSKIIVVGGDGKTYTTRAEAQKELAVVCK